MPALGRLRKLWVDAGYSRSDFADWVRGQLPKVAVEVIERSDDVQGFKVLPKRWSVERTLGWLVKHRRRVRDYEAARWIPTAHVRVMLRRLAYSPIHDFFDDL